MVFATLLTTVLLALAVAADPIPVKRSLVTLPISRRINLNGFSILEHDQLRAKGLKAKGEARASGTPLSDRASVISSQAENQAVSYVASIGVGSPATQYSLIVDTGSSNTWVGATKAYVKTSTSTQTANSVSVTYGSGSFSGTEFTDQVTITTGLVITGQSIGVASRSTGFEGVDGIIGIGPVDLTLDTLRPARSSEIPTVTDNLFSQGTISAHEIAVSFEPLTQLNQLNGELTWGGTDSTKFTGSITFTPITSTAPSSEFWGINQSIEYGTTTILSLTAGIVDTGTTLILIATNAFTKYESLTGATLDPTTGLLKVTSTQFSNLQTLTFIVGGVSFGLTPNGQIWPRALNADIGGVSGAIYLIVGDIGNNSGSGLDFINGQTFLERFYSVFDTANKRVGLATTPFTDATTN
jgi:cathepsin E